MVCDLPQDILQGCNSSIYGLRVELHFNNNIFQTYIKREKIRTDTRYTGKRRFLSACPDFSSSVPKRLSRFISVCPDFSASVPISQRQSQFLSCCPIAQSLSRFLSVCPDCSASVPISQRLSQSLSVCSDFSAYVPISQRLPGDYFDDRMSGDSIECRRCHGAPILVPICICNHGCPMDSGGGVGVHGRENWIPFER